MIRNYFKIALRNLTKNLVFTSINLAGLSLGIATFILIFQYISFEESVNKFHTNLPALYKVVNQDNQGNVWEDTAPGLASYIKQEFGEVQAYCRIIFGSNIGDGVVAYKDAKGEVRSFREHNFVYAEGNFFDVFSFQMVDGSKEALLTPNTLALSESTARKYFGSPQIIGKVVTLNNQFGETLYTVGAVYADMPENSDFRFDLIFSLETLKNKANLNGNENWASLEGLNSQWIITYLQLYPGAKAEQLEKKINELSLKLSPTSTNLFRLQPLAHQHLAKSLNDPLPTSGNLGFIYLLSGIAILILVIAWLNYINLSTAASIKRAKEVGIRKVVGANRSQIIRQFLSESVIVNAISVFVALAIVNLVQDSYNYFIGKRLGLFIFQYNHFWVFGALLISVGALLSGAYAAFVLSSYKPAETLKGVFANSRNGVGLRKILVVFQFSISIILIGCTIILFKQLDFLQNKNLGISLNQLMIINEPEVGKDSTFVDRTKGFENELVQLSFVEGYSLSGNVPMSGYNFSTPGITSQNSLDGDEKLSYAMVSVDYRYFDIYDVGFVAGKNFTEQMSANWNNPERIIVNERALFQLGFLAADQAIGQKINWQGRECELIGVVKNYNHLSLYQVVDPMIFIPINRGIFTVKLSTQNITSNIAALENLFRKYFAGNPFDYYFIDQKYNQLYKTEQHYSALFTFASSLAIFIACLGLFGLATFTIEQRIKEIGIRKVLGASLGQIVSLVSRDFLILVFISILISTPISWYLMNKWLITFAYRVDINLWTFVLAGIISISIALITISTQAIKAGKSNPVDSLKIDN